MAKGATFSGHTHIQILFTPNNEKTSLWSDHNWTASNPFPICVKSRVRMRFKFRATREKKCSLSTDRLRDGCKCSQMLPQLHCMMEVAEKNLIQWQKKKKLLPIYSKTPELKWVKTLVWAGRTDNRDRSNTRHAHTKTCSVCVCYQCCPASQLFPAKHPFPWQPRRETGSVSHRKYF